MPGQAPPVLPGLVVLMGAQRQQHLERRRLRPRGFQLDLCLAQILQQFLREGLVRGHVHCRLLWHPDSARPVAPLQECPLSSMGADATTG